MYIYTWSVNGRYIPRRRTEYERDTRPRVAGKGKQTQCAIQVEIHVGSALTGRQETNQPTCAGGVISGTSMSADRPRAQDKRTGSPAISPWPAPQPSRGNHRYAVTQRGSRITGFRRRKFVGAQRANLLPRGLWGMRLLFRRSSGVEVAT